MIDSIETKLMQLEQTKKELKCYFYELNKFWIFFIHKNHFLYYFP
jgi:hypothetical protein